MTARGDQSQPPSALPHIYSIINLEIKSFIINNSKGLNNSIIQGINSPSIYDILYSIYIFILVLDFPLRWSAG